MPNGYFGGPPVGGPMGPGGSYGFGMIGEQKLYEMSSSYSKVEDKRVKINVTSARRIPGIHFIARLKTRLKLRNTKGLINTANKQLRKNQIKLSVLQNMEQKSQTYGDSLKILSDLDSKSLQKRLDKENSKEDLNYTLPTKPKFIGRIKKGIARFNENIYIKLYITKAMMSYSKSNKRKTAMSEAEKGIDLRKTILKGYAYHNYNIYSIQIGSIKPEDNYKGLLKDSVDTQLLNQLTSAKGTTTQTQNNNQNTKNNQQVINNANTNTNTNTNTNSNVNQPVASSTNKDDSNNKQTTPIQNNQSKNESIDNSEYHLKNDNIIQDDIYIKPTPTTQENNKTKVDFTKNEYHLEKKDIIQDLDINSKEEQIFKTKGMTKEEIQKSRELLDMLTANDSKQEENTKGRTR